MRPVPKLLLSTTIALPAAIYGFSTGPLPKHTGAPVDDNGATCAVCHRTYGSANTDPRGHLMIQAGPYTPGVPQIIRVTLTHPEAMRWGFQLTARLASDETKEAGTFTVTDQIRVRCEDPNLDAPCNGTLEFASHKRDASLGIDSTHPGTSGGSTWEIEWTPPAQDAGEVVLYAAGNAANNNGNPTGDHIYTTRVRITAAAGCQFTAKPSITAVVNGASFRPGLGFNSCITVFGSGLASPGLQRAADQFDLVDGKFPPELGCMSVMVNGVSVPVTYIDEHQINAQAPASAISGAVRVEVRQNQGRPTEASAAMPGVPMQIFAPAFFLSGASQRVAALHADFTPVSNDAPAKPGETITLFGTGFGITNPVWQPGELPDGPAPLTAPFTITIGGVTLPPDQVTYAGLSPQSISALYQFNVRIPDTAPDGDMPVAVAIGGLATQDGATVPVKR